MIDAEAVLQELRDLPDRMRYAGDNETMRGLFQRKVELVKLIRENPEAFQGVRSRPSPAMVRRAEQEAAARRERYHRYLQTDEWRERRAVAIRKAGGRCQVCNGSDRLEVHHRTYERFGAELEDDLTVLCEDCHGLYERHKRLRRAS